MRFLSQALQFAYHVLSHHDFDLNLIHPSAWLWKLGAAEAFLFLQSFSCVMDSLQITIIKLISSRVRERWVLDRLDRGLAGPAHVWRCGPHHVPRLSPGSRRRLSSSRSSRRSSQRSPSTGKPSLWSSPRDPNGNDHLTPQGEKQRGNGQRSQCTGQGKGQRHIAIETWIMNGLSSLANTRPPDLKKIRSGNNTLMFSYLRHGYECPEQFIGCYDWSNASVRSS